MANAMTRASWIARGPWRLPQAAWLLLLVVALACPALVLPWFVPVRPARSESYMYGFSNPALWALILGAVIAPAFVLARSRWCALLPGVSPSEATVLPAHSMDRLKAWALASCAVFAIFLLACAYDMADFMEADYFLSRVALLAAGKTPYLDFEFAYGVLLLHIPLALQKLGISPSLALVTSILAETVIGYLAVRAILDRVLPPVAARYLLFAIVISTAPGLLMAGESYTFFRFAAAPALACMLVARHARREGHWMAAAAGPMSVLAWLISPEIGLATACSLVASAFVLSRARWRNLCVSVLSVVACAAATPLLVPSYRMVLEFGGGGGNLPAVPGPHILLALLTVVLATLQLASHPLRERPVDTFLYLFSLALIPGMFGRCDAVHVVFYGFGFTALAAKYCVEHRVRGLGLRSFAVAYIWIYLACWAAIHTHYTWYRYVAVSARTVVAGSAWIEPVMGPLPEGLRRLAMYSRKIDTWNPDPSLARADRIRVIPPRYDMPGIDRYSLHAVAIENAFTAGAFEAVAREIAGKRVLIWSAMFHLCEPAPTNNAVLVMFPINVFKVKHEKHEVAHAFCAKLQDAKFIARHGSFVELDIPE